MKALRTTLVVLLLVSVVALPVGAKTTLEYYSMWNQGEDQQIVLQQAIEDFEKEYPDIDVKVTWAGRDILTKARTRLLMGNPPDLMDQSFNELWASLLAHKELALPMNEFLDSEGPEGQSSMGSLFYEEILSLYEKDGNIYFIPYEYITSGFFYDKNMFARYGLDVPKTWDELLQVAETLKANGIAPFAQDGSVNFYNAYWYYWLTNRLMGKGALLEAASDPTGKAFDDPGFLRAAEMIYEISKADKNYFIDGYEGSTWPAAQISWANGDAAMILCGSWIPNETNDARHEDFEIGFFPFPTIEGGDDTFSMEAYLIGFAVPKQADNPEAAKKFVRFFLKKKYQEGIAKQAQNMPGRKDVGYPEILTDVRPYVEQADTFHIEYDATQGRVPEWFNTVFCPLDDKLLFGEITPEEFIKQLKEDTVAYWAKKK